METSILEHVGYLTAYSFLVSEDNLSTDAASCGYKKEKSYVGFYLGCTPKDNEKGYSRQRTEEKFGS